MTERKDSKRDVANEVSSTDFSVADRSRTLERMQKVLERLGMPSLQVVWMPDDNRQVHGEIKGTNIFIYDKTEEMCLQTFMHEVYEYRFKESTRLYRSLVNSLIEVIEKEIYARKEAFFDFIPMFQQVMEDVVNLQPEKENKAKKTAQKN
jgi:broad specificity phosphatase PhoE